MIRCFAFSELSSPIRCPIFSAEISSASRTFCIDAFSSAFTSLIPASNDLPALIAAVPAATAPVAVAAVIVLNILFILLPAPVQYWAACSEAVLLLSPISLFFFLTCSLVCFDAVSTCFSADFAEEAMLFPVCFAVLSTCLPVDLTDVSALLPACFTAFPAFFAELSVCLEACFAETSTCFTDCFTEVSAFFAAWPAGTRRKQRSNLSAKSIHSSVLTLLESESLIRFMKR